MQWKVVPLMINLVAQVQMLFRLFSENPCRCIIFPSDSLKLISLHWFITQYPKKYLEEPSKLQQSILLFCFVFMYFSSSQLLPLELLASSKMYSCLYSSTSPVRTGTKCIKLNCRSSLLSFQLLLCASSSNRWPNGEIRNTFIFTILYFTKKCVIVGRLPEHTYFGVCWLSSRAIV